MKVQKIINWIWENKEVKFNKIGQIEGFITDSDLATKFKDLLIEKSIWTEIGENEYILKETAEIFKNKKISEIEPLIEEIFNKKDTIGSDYREIASWESLHSYLKKFIIYKGEIMLYEFIFEIGGKQGIVKLEGKEIMDYKNFILKFFEEYGTMLPIYRGINSDWNKLLTLFYQNYAEINYEKSEMLSPLLEAKELVLDSIEESIISDDYSLKEGIICLKNDILFVSTKVIKRLLKRNDNYVSMRNLAYILKDYLIAVSTPIKVGNKSERFWRFNPRKVKYNIENKLETSKEEDE